jgi:hypothetical protein
LGGGEDEDALYGWGQERTEGMGGGGGGDALSGWGLEEGAGCNMGDEGTVSRTPQWLPLPPERTSHNTSASKCGGYSSRPSGRPTTPPGCEDDAKHHVTKIRSACYREVLQGGAGPRGGFVRGKASGVSGVGGGLGAEWEELSAALKEEGTTATAAAAGTGWNERTQNFEQRSLGNAVACSAMVRQQLQQWQVFLSSSSSDSSSSEDEGYNKGSKMGHYYLPSFALGNSSGSGCRVHGRQKPPAGVAGSGGSVTRAKGCVASRAAAGDAASNAHSTNSSSSSIISSCIGSGSGVGGSIWKGNSPQVLERARRLGLARRPGGSVRRGKLDLGTQHGVRAADAVDNSS